MSGRERERVGGAEQPSRAKLIKTHNRHQRQLKPLREREREQRKTQIKGRNGGRKGCGGCQQVVDGVNQEHAMMAYSVKIRVAMATVYNFIDINPGFHEISCLVPL